MIDCKKAEQAKKLLIESGLPVILAYGKDDEHFGSGAWGEYQTLKKIYH